MFHQHTYKDISVKYYVWRKKQNQQEKKQNTHTQTHTHTHTHTHADRHTHMQTHTHKHRQRQKKTKLRQRTSPWALNADATECQTNNNLQPKFSKRQTWLASRHAQRNHATLLTAVFLQQLHICQPHLGVNLSPEFVNLYFPYAGWGLLRVFFWWQWHFEFQPERVALEGRSNVMLNMYAWLQISLLMRILSLLPRPVSVHLAMVCAGCLFNTFAVFLLSLKQNNCMKITFSWIHFWVWLYPP